MKDTETTRFQIKPEKDREARRIIGVVLRALREKGYDPVSQLVGYFLSDDPTYITNYEGARGVIRQMERYELLEVILQDYINTVEQPEDRE
ncbi:MAG: IreB family regulatory phosphoprotein [Clostridiaceae bacterium]|nr:IreB family regulatory phosphoprotein [Clostridiaceae bacterium]